MKFNERALKGLIEESQDLQSGAMRDARESRAELREIGASRAGQAPDLDRLREYSVGRRHLLKTGGFGLGILASGGLLSTAFGQRAAAIVNRPLQADVDVDIQIFQTASSLENLAVATYGAALTLPFIAENAVVATFAETTMMQHAEHGAAFNAQSEALGGARQEETNPKYTPIVEDAKAGLTDALAVVQLAATLEEVATDTYLANLTLLSDGNMRTLMASVMGSVRWVRCWKAEFPSSSPSRPMSPPCRRPPAASPSRRRSKSPTWPARPRREQSNERPYRPSPHR
jgi:hypothetical protein